MLAKYGKPPLCRFFMKSGTQGEVADVITCTEFLVNSIFTQFVEELRSSSTPKLSFPENSVCRPYNSVLIIINYNICQQLSRTVCRRGTPRHRWVRRGPRRRQETRTRPAKERKAARSLERRSDCDRLPESDKV